MQSEEPSTSTGRRGSSAKRPRSSRKSSRKKRTTKYKVELVTTEDGTTVEVKLAIQSRQSRKKKKKSSKRSSRRVSSPYISLRYLFLCKQFLSDFNVYSRR